MSDFFARIAGKHILVENLMIISNEIFSVICPGSDTGTHGSLKLSGRSYLLEHVIADW
jgi:hypothetical protein